MSDLAGQETFKFLCEHFNMDVAGFMSKWADVVRDAQSEEGAVPAVVPNEAKYGTKVEYKR